MRKGYRTSQASTICCSQADFEPSSDPRQDDVDILDGGYCSVQRPRKTEVLVAVAKACGGDMSWRAWHGSGKLWKTRSLAVRKGALRLRGFLHRPWPWEGRVRFRQEARRFLQSLLSTSFFLSSRSRPIARDRWCCYRAKL